MNIDKRKLYQVISNLLSNAIKFTASYRNNNIDNDNNGNNNNKGKVVDMLIMIISNNNCRNDISPHLQNISDLILRVEVIDQGMGITEV
jgi:signal transduction histidine kinase